MKIKYGTNISDNRKNFNIVKKLVFVLMFTSLINYSLACTAVDIKASDGSVIAGRTMEWAFNMNWEFLYYPAGTNNALNAPTNLNLPTVDIKSKYAVFGIGTALENNAMLDGQNSAGLGISGNFLPGFTQYMKVNKNDSKYLSVLDLVKFVLGNYATADEVKDNLLHYKVWAPKINNLPIEPTIHFIVTDKSGKNIVIEFVDGNMKIFNQTTGVLTNSPNYDWHMTNIRNYLNLSNTATSQITTKTGNNLTQLGQGGGSLGLPGDYTPPSRFVKTTFLAHYALEPNNAKDAIELTGHILNNVDIPIGVVSASSNGRTDSDYTQWEIIKDLSHNEVYFSDYAHRLNSVKIDLNKIFNMKKSLALPIENLHYPDNNVTGQF